MLNVKTSAAIIAKSSKIINGFAAVAIILLVSGCIAIGDNVSKLRALNPQHGDFSSSLAAEYLDYAQSLLESEHPIAANYFASKGIKSFNKEIVLPEATGWFENAETSEDLTEKRKNLLAVLTPDIQEIAPEKAARAQLLFDCYYRGEIICEKSFAEALSDLQFIADAVVHGEDNHFILSFAPSSSTLSDQANLLLDFIANRVLKYGTYQIETLPYSARQRADHKARQLDNARILLIEKGLIQRGVDAGKIHSHRKRKSTIVTLSSDDGRLDQNSVLVSIQTYGQPAEDTETNSGAIKP